MLTFQIDTENQQELEELHRSAKEVFQRLEGKVEKEEGKGKGQTKVPVKNKEVAVRISKEVPVKGAKETGGKEASSSPEPESEFAKVFAQLRGQARLD